MIEASALSSTRRSAIGSYRRALEQAEIKLRAKAHLGPPQITSKAKSAPDPPTGLLD